MALFLLLVHACGAGGSSALQFVVPPAGSVIDAPLRLAVVGSGIAHATFDVDGTVVGEVSAPPFEWMLDPLDYSGSHVVTIVAARDDGDHAMSVTLNFAGVVFLTPADGAVVTKPTSLAADGATITSVEFKLDGATMLLDTSAPFSWVLDPAAVADGSHDVSIEAFLGNGSRTHALTLRTVKPATDPPPPADVLTAIQNLKPGEWYEIPDTKLRDVAMSPSPGGTISGIMSAWSSGAYDTKRDRLIIWGGGHGDYGGNELYVFSMKSFRWTRLNDPTLFPPGEEDNPQDKTSHPDGSPVARHSYDYIQYIPSVDKFFVGGGGGIWLSGQFGDDMTYLFDLDTLSWTQHGVCPSAGISTSALGPDGRVWMHGSAGSGAVLSAFDAKTSVWTRYAEYNSWIGYARSAVIDPVENKYVLVGDGQVRIWDLSDPYAQHVVAKTTGDVPQGEFDYPGLAFDPVTKRIVAWAGGATVYSLDVATLAWTAHATKGVNTTPPAAARNGTHGRWRYVPSLGVIVNVNDVDENVFVYRHS
ncbi:MAG TPA: Ig-like domain-containing protein [Planctomycetota bacterium]|nr:Ig-like domain-containing protein [Planctomycetota bacterium]